MSSAEQEKIGFAIGIPSSGFNVIQFFNAYEIERIEDDLLLLKFALFPNGFGVPINDYSFTIFLADIFRHKESWTRFFGDLPDIDDDSEQKYHIQPRNTDHATFLNFSRLEGSMAEVVVSTGSTYALVNKLRNQDQSFEQIPLALLKCNVITMTRLLQSLIEIME